MADKDSEDKPSLELPSFGFGRKKDKSKPAEPIETTEPVIETTPEPTPERAVAPPTPPTPPTPAPPTPAPPASGTTPDVGVESTATLSTPSPTPPAPSTAARPRASRRPAPVKTAPSEVTRTETVVSSTDASPLRPTTSPDDVGLVDAPPKAGRRLNFPAIPALQAVLVIGAIVGLLGVLLTFASLKFCELATGTDSCGGPGLLLLVATVVLLTYVGSWLLRGFGIADAGSLSFLAVALLAVMVMVFFLDVIYSWWMVLVIPPVSMAMYALSWWVTTSLVDNDTRRDSRPR